MKNNNLYAKLDALKAQPVVREFSDELLEKHMILGNIDMVGLIDELLETADYQIIRHIDI